MQRAVSSSEALELGHEFVSSIAKASSFGEHDVSLAIGRFAREFACKEDRGRYLASGVAACGFSGALMYLQRSTRAHSEDEREQLGLIAELLSLALSKEAFTSAPARIA